MSTGSERCWPVAVWPPVARKLRRRSSSGVRPTTLAILSMWRSSAKMLCGAPKPRKAPWGGTLVAMALARTGEERPVVGAGGVDGAARQDDGREGGIGAAVDGEVDLCRRGALPSFETAVRWRVREGWRLVVAAMSSARS